MDNKITELSKIKDTLSKFKELEQDMKTQIENIRLSIVDDKHNLLKTWELTREICKKKQT